MSCLYLRVMLNDVDWIVLAVCVWPWLFNTMFVLKNPLLILPWALKNNQCLLTMCACVCLWPKLVYPGNWMSNHCPYSIWWNQKEREMPAKSVELLIKPSVPVEMRQRCHNGLWWGRVRQSQMVGRFIMGCVACFRRLSRRGNMPFNLLFTCSPAS